MVLIPKIDQAFLDEKAFDHELKQVGNEVHLVLRSWPFPAAYSPRSADMLVRMPQGYPLTPMDMFWTIPDIRLSSNGAWPQAGEYHEIFDGRSWQRWSRHITWRPGVDNLRTYLTAVTAEIMKGI